MTDTKLRELLVVIDDHYGRARNVYVTKIAGWIAPYLRLDRLKRNKVQRALDIAGLQLTPC